MWLAPWAASCKCSNDVSAWACHHSCKARGLPWCGKGACHCASTVATGALGCCGKVQAVSKSAAALVAMAHKRVDRTLFCKCFIQ